MSTFIIKQGSTLPALASTLQKSDGTAIDLTASDVTVTMTSASGSVVINEQAVQVISATAGTVQYNWQTGDLDTAGDYNLEFTVTYDAGGVLKVPSRNYSQVIVTESLT